MLLLTAYCDYSSWLIEYKIGTTISEKKMRTYFAPWLFVHCCRWDVAEIVNRQKFHLHLFATKDCKRKTILSEVVLVVDFHCRHGHPEIDIDKTDIIKTRIWRNRVISSVFGRVYLSCNDTKLIIISKNGTSLKFQLENICHRESV